MDNKKASLIIGSAFGTMVLLGGSLYEYQEGKIDALKDELYLKKQNEQRATDYYESIMNVKTIQSKFNVLNEYAILKDSIVSMNHTYYYTSDSILGLKKQIVLKGRGQLQYSVNVNLSSAVITQQGKNIIIEIEKPYVDKESVHLKANTLIMDEADANWVSNKYDSMEAQRLYNDSFNESGKNNILDLYGTEEKQNYLNKVAKAEVESLIKTLNLTNCNIIVRISK